MIRGLAERGDELRPTRRSNLALATLLGASLALGLSAAAGAAPDRKPKPNLPDLVPTAGHLTGNNPYAFLGKSFLSSWKGTIKNVGGGKAGPTLTRVYLAHTRLTNNFPARFGLADGATAKIKAGENGPTTANGRRLDPALPPGAYILYVCADVKHDVTESNEKNNCRLVGAPKRFYLAFKRWTGTLRGTAPMTWGGDTREDWQSGDVAFDFSEYRDPGFFEYDFRGTVSFTEHGTSDGDCSVIGNGFGQGVAGILALQYEAEVYNAQASANLHSFDYSVFCGNQENKHHGPANFVFLITDPVPGTPQPLPFGTRNISGGFTDDFDVNYTWDWTGVAG